MQNWNISKNICNCLHKLTSDWMLRIAIRPNWNNYYNIANVLTTLHLSQMKRISSSHYFFHLFTNSTSQHVPMTALSLCKYKLVCSVLQRVDIGRIYSLNAQILKFDWSTQILWKHKAAGKSDLFEKALIFGSTTTPKLTKILVVIFSCPFYFHKTDWKEAIRRSSLK